MNVLYPVLCYYPSQAGGPANTLYWQNSALAANNIGTITISSNFGLAKSEDLIELSRSCSYKDHKVFFTNKSFFSSFFLSVKQLKKCQVIHFSSVFYPITLPLLLVSWLLRKSIVISPRGELYASALAVNEKQKSIWLKLIKLFQRKINFHATNNYEAGLIKSFFPQAKSTEVLANFIRLPEQLNCDVKNKFLFLGRINPIKNIDVLIDAFSKLAESKNQIELVIIGSARLPAEKKYLAQLKEQVARLRLESSIIFRGHLDGLEKQRELASAKALVLPSKSENFGNVVLEALAQSTPVIASIGAPWQLLKDCAAGAWVEPTENSLYLAMQNILNLDHANYIHMRSNALALCKKFDIESNIHLWIQYYKKMK
tara:strand:- start:770 stop:1882 length:1113 start_codon:yes stop_codon:yes gene_type:complete